MSQIIQIVQTEKERSEVTRNVIHLYQEGTFYRAYNWSAWLCHRFIQQFKVTHKNLKGIEDSVLFVGFPLTSLEKYFGDYPRQEVGEKAIDVLLPTNMVPEDMVIEMMSTDYEVWKSSIPLTISNAKQKENAHEVTDGKMSFQKSPNTLTSIMQQILAFPLEQKTPIECMLFVAEAKQNLARLI